MNSISSDVKRLLNASVHLLNQPIAKGCVKNATSSITFIFGMIDVYDIYQISRGREISTGTCLNSPKWIQVATKIVVVCAKTSLILSAGVSRPGVFIISSIFGRVFSTTQLERVFGPNTIFAINPWHPRHVISISALILALPSVVQSTYKGINWMYRKICHHQAMSKQDIHHWLIDFKIRLMALFNTITSRPTLHVGNQLGRFILHHF